MTARDDNDRPRPDSPPEPGGAVAGDDVLELESRQLPVLRHRPPLIAVILAAAGLLVGLVAGYTAGDRHGKNGAAALSPSRVSASPAAPAAAGAVTVTQTGRQCSAQIGHALQLGVQITNQSATGVTLRLVEVVLPLGGLKITARAWGPCGELPPADDPPETALPAGASTWFTVTFKVLVKCPAALPVQFTLDYDELGRTAAIQLPGFADLGQVPYPSCPAS